MWFALVPNEDGMAFSQDHGRLCQTMRRDTQRNTPVMSIVIHKGTTSARPACPSQVCFPLFPCLSGDS